MMLRRQTYRLILSAGVLLFSLANVGCFTLALREPMANQSVPVHSIPYAARAHVYVVILDTFDPLQMGNLSGLPIYLNRLGFPRTLYGQCYHQTWLSEEMAKIHQADPAARFVLVGNRLGKMQLESMMRTCQSVPIDLVVVVGEKHHVTVSSGAGCESCETNQVIAVRNLSNRYELDELVNHLVGVAASVPLVYQDAPTQITPNYEQMPSPRSIEVPTATSNRWDALTPRSQLLAPPNVPPVLEVIQHQPLSSFE